MSKVGFEENPTLTRLRGFEAALTGVQAQDGGRHVQEQRRFLQVEGAHTLFLVIVFHPHVVAACLGAGFSFHVLGKRALFERLIAIEMHL